MESKIDVHSLRPSLLYARRVLLEIGGLSRERVKSPLTVKPRSAPERCASSEAEPFRDALTVGRQRVRRLEHPIRRM